MKTNNKLLLQKEMKGEELSNKKAIETSLDQRSKKKSDQSNHIPLYLSNSSFQFDEQQQLKYLDNSVNKKQIQKGKEVKQSTTDSSPQYNDGNNVDGDSTKQKFFGQQQLNKRGSISNESDNSSGVLCRNRRLFTQQQNQQQLQQQQQMKQEHPTSEQQALFSNKQERVQNSKQLQDNLFVIFNPNQQQNCISNDSNNNLQEFQNLISLKQLQRNQEKAVLTLPTQANVPQQTFERNITNKTENRQQTYTTTEETENEDYFNQDYFMQNIQINNNNNGNINEQTNYIHNNICDITTITDSVQANEDFKCNNTTSFNKKKMGLESSDNSFEIEMNKKQRLQLKNMFKPTQEVNDQKDQKLFLKKKRRESMDSNYNLSQIIQNKEQELVDLREQKRKFEEENSRNSSHISIEQHQKQINELKIELVQKDNMIKELNEKIKILEKIPFEKETNEDQLTQELKERDQIIYTLQKDLKEKLCDSESYKDKIKFYHEQSVKQQTNDILVCQLTSTIKQQQYQIDKFDMTKKQKEDTILDLENQVFSLKQQFKSNQEDLSKFRNENQDYLLKVKDLQRDSESLQKQLSELKYTYDSLSSENNKLKEKYIQKIQQMNSEQEQKCYNEIEQKLNQKYSYSMPDKNYTLGNNDLIQAQLKNINADIGQNTKDDFFDYTNEMPLQQQDQTQEGKNNILDNRRNSLIKNNNSYQMIAIPPPINEQKLNRTHLNVSALNLSSDVCDVFLQNSPSNQNFRPPQFQETRLKERTSSQESIMMPSQYNTSSQVKQHNNFMLNEKENNYNIKVSDELYKQSKPRNQRSNSSTDYYPRSSSSQANYSSNNVSIQQQHQNNITQSSINYAPPLNNYSSTNQFSNNQQQNNYLNSMPFDNNNLNTTNGNIYSNAALESTLNFESKLPLQERNTGGMNMPYFNTTNAFFRKNSDLLDYTSTMSKPINYYLSSNKYNKSNYSNKENNNTTSIKKQLNQTYEYLTNVRSSSPLNTSFSNVNKHQQPMYPSSNEKAQQSNYGKFRYGVPPPIPIQPHLQPSVQQHLAPPSTTTYSKQYKL